MAKLVKKIKLQIKAGLANPAPPVGPVLSQAGVNIQDFCGQFNDQTRDRMGQVVPVVISVFDDKSFTFELREPPAANLIREKIKLQKGSGEPNKKKVGNITRKQLEEVAAVKMKELNAHDLDAAVSILAGTARSMGVTVEG
ncbi:MAG: 50S ribosomal protein L11 [Candidatus Gracilibacteria bacterium]|nr:50S ribosomal protein L11 [bacterium]MDZ4217201.1 50S ribosomal protein L11 [Candidatus Gracilibacteria bacterium]